MTEHSSPSIIILGVSGSGKTEVAQALSDALDATCIENTTLAEENLGAPLSEMMTDDPERALEALAVAASELLANSLESHVLVLSPSAVLNPEVREKLLSAKKRGALVVGLRAPLQTLVRRTGLNAPQPVPLGAPRAWFRAQVAELEGAYSDLVDLWCDTGTGDAEMTARLIKEELALRTGGSSFTD